MNIEKFQIPIKNNKEIKDKEKDFAKLWQEVITNKNKEELLAVNYDLPYPKEDLLTYLVTNKEVVLHGSDKKDIEILEPKQANDRAKEFGNKNGVYVVTDSVLPIFYAIQNREKISGLIISGVESDSDTKEKKYEFKMSKKVLDTKPWTNGMVYILDKNNFQQGVDDSGELIDEWVSEMPIKPLAKLEVQPEDFRFLNKIKSLE